MSTVVYVEYPEKPGFTVEFLKCHHEKWFNSSLLCWGGGMISKMDISKHQNIEPKLSVRLDNSRGDEEIIFL